MSKKKKRPSGRPQKIAKDFFEQSWDGAMLGAVKAEIAASCPRSKTSKAFEQRFLGPIEALFVQRKVVQEAVFKLMRQELKGEAELMDLLSGDAVATLPLLLTKDIRRLDLVDNGASPKQRSVSQMLAKKLGVQRSVRSHEITISETSQPSELPQTRVALLSDTGFALPIQNRMTVEVLRGNYDIQNPAAYRGAHVFNPSAGLSEVLSVLELSGRRLHLVETPYHRTSLSVNDWGDHLADIIGKDSAWQITDVQEFLEKTGTLRAVLDFS